MSDTRFQVLLHLSDGKFHAGTKLAGVLGISRAAIWKHIQHLQADGFPVQATQGKGYRLGYPICLLDKKKIIRHSLLKGNDLDVTVVRKTTSTNDWLKQRMEQGMVPGSVCIAEQQIAGRGTQGRQWYSPPGVNIYLSFYWLFEKAPVALSGLSLAVAVSLAQVLESKGCSGIMIKWPNDLYTKNGKLGGILIDMLAETNGPTRAIIGVGLNASMTPEHKEQIEQPVDDLTWQSSELGLDRNQLAAMIIDTLHRCCEEYEELGFDYFRRQWPRWDMTQGKAVMLRKGQQDILGIADGVDESGALVLLTEAGKTSHASGDVSLRVSSHETTD